MTGSFELDLLFVAAGAAVAGGLAVLLLVRLLSRRETGADVRELSRALSDLGEGRFDRLPAADPEEPLAPLVHSVADLASSLRRRDDEYERRLEAIRARLDHIRGIAFVGTDANGDVTHWSSGARELLGWPAEEVRGRPAARLFAEGSWDMLIPKLSRRELREGAGLTERARMRRRGGGDVPVVVTVALSDESGEPGLSYTIQDASETENLETELRESEEKYRRLAESLGEGAFVLQAGRVTFANRAFERLLGASEDVLSEREFRDLVSSEDLLRVMALVKQIESGHTAAPFDVSLRGLPEGEPVPARLTMAPAKIGGEPAVIGCARSVAASTQSVKWLEASQARLDATLEATSDGILLLAGPPGRQSVVVANERLRELLGVEPRTLFDLDGVDVGRRLASALKQQERFLAFFEGLSQSPRDASGGLFELPGEAGRVLEVYSAPAPARDGRIAGRVFSFRDVTGREALARSKQTLERANADLERINTELGAKGADLDRLNQELRSLDQMKSALLANVTHELQTPLVSIKGYSDMILKGRLGSITNEQRRGLEISLRNIDRLIGMIDNLLALARSEKEMPTMEVSSFPLWELIEECIETVRDQAEQRHITMSTRYLTDDLIVRGDRAKVSQVFLNLLANAIKFNRESGEVTPTVRRGKKGYLLIEIRDTGIGIPEDDLDKVFDRGFRASGASENEVGGSGLGLAIVRDILRMHGCTIRAESRVGEGSNFTFTLPAATATTENGPALSGGRTAGES